MITNVLLERLVAEDEPKSPGAVRINGLLQVQFVEGNRMLGRFRADLFNGCEMKLAVDDPVICHIEYRAIL